MRIIYTYHAKKRMKQRGLNSLHVEYILNHPDYVKNSIDNTKEATGSIENRSIKVVFVVIENYINIITVI